MTLRSDEAQAAILEDCLVRALALTDIYSLGALKILRERLDAMLVGMRCDEHKTVIRAYLAMLDGEIDEYDEPVEAEETETSAVRETGIDAAWRRMMDQPW